MCGGSAYVTDQAQSVVGSHRKSLCRLLAVRRCRGHAGHVAPGTAVHALHRAGHPGRELRVAGGSGRSRRVHELMRAVAGGHRVAGGVRVGARGVVVRVHGAHHAVARRRRRRERLGQLLLLLAILGATVLKPDLTTPVAASTRFNFTDQF